MKATAYPPGRGQECYFGPTAVWKRMGTQLNFRYRYKNFDNDYRTLNLVSNVKLLMFYMTSFTRFDLGLNSFWDVVVKLYFSCKQSY